MVLAVRGECCLPSKKEEGVFLGADICLEVFTFPKHWVHVFGEALACTFVCVHFNDRWSLIGSLLPLSSVAGSPSHPQIHPPSPSGFLSGMNSPPGLSPACHLASVCISHSPPSSLFLFVLLYVDSCGAEQWAGQKSVWI
jgi:hypothetical protein